MGLIVRVPRRLRRSRRFRFGDDVELVVVGRDPDRCQIMFPPRMRGVGLEHLALHRVLGRYRLVLNEEDAVLVNGREAVDGEELPDRCVLHLGIRGPRLIVERTRRKDLQPTERDPGSRWHHAGPRAVLSSVRANRRLALGAAALVVLAAGFLVWATWRSRKVEPEGEPALWAALERAVPSVYRVILRTADGGEHGGGTAWVVGEHRLATNAHVAKHFEDAPPGARLQVRSSGPRPRTHDVVAVTLHPGFEAFEVLWRGYQPAEGSHPSRLEPIPSAGGSADVALLEVEAGAALGPPLVLADEATLRALAPGDVVGYVGFPSEALALHGSPVQRPTPHRQTGRITLVTSFFGVHGLPASNHLLQLTCPATGGVSGSPLFDVRGRVVGLMSAANFAHGWHGRIPSGAGINYAQRADLLRELLEDRAEAVLPERLREWTAGLEQAFPSAWRMLRGERIQARLRALSDRHQVDSRDTEVLEWTRVSSRFVEVGVEAPAEAAEQPGVEVLQAGRHVLVVSPLLAREIDVSAHYVGEDGTRTPHPGRDGLVDLLAPGPGVLHVALAAKDHPVRAELLLYRAAPRPITVSLLRRRLLEDWSKMRRQPRFAGAVGEPALVLEEVARLGDGSDRAPSWEHGLAMPGAGALLVLAVAREVRAITLDVGPAQWSTLYRDDSPSGRCQVLILGGVESGETVPLRAGRPRDATYEVEVRIFAYFAAAAE